jgi:hypothetical protein
LLDRNHRLFWPSRGVLAVPGGVSSEVKAKAAELGILDVIEVPAEPGGEAPANLLKALGIS